MKGQVCLPCPAPEFLGQLCCPCRWPATATLQARISPNLLFLSFFFVLFSPSSLKTLSLSPHLPVFLSHPCPWSPKGLPTRLPILGDTRVSDVAADTGLREGWPGLGKAGAEEGKTQGSLDLVSVAGIYTDKLLLLVSCSIISDSCDPMDCSPPGSSVLGFSDKNTGVGCHALLQGISPPRNRTCVPYVSCIGRRVLSHCFPAPPC